MSIITLTTDYGLKDHFVGALKGKVLSNYPEAVLVDLSHLVDPFNISETSYILNAASPNFPIGTVHIVGVDCERNRENEHIALKWNDQYFIAADNGILSLLTQVVAAQKIVKINIHEFMLNNSTDMDVFIKVAIHLAKGGMLHEVGEEISAIKEVTEAQPITSADLKTIKGTIVYIDHYGNAVTNISKKVFQAIATDRTFTIKTRNTVIKTILERYSDLGAKDNASIKDQESKTVAVFNENNVLEIAIYKSNQSFGSANSLLGLNYRDVVTIEFTD
ncbi:MAG: SAM-dependent chlorinase/fluorinase [Flavobacterium sp.]|nr:SAM-dependent chlorinase/fluorinase [Flavobacterium sp.]